MQDNKMLMDKVMYEQLVSLLDVYKRSKKYSGNHDEYIFNSGAIDALNKLKRRIELTQGHKV